MRHLSAAGNGTLAFSWDGDIYTMRPGSEPQKLAVEIIADQYDGDRVKYFTDRGATTMAVSPSGNELAFVIRGDVYVTDAKYKTTKRITDTPAQERYVCLSQKTDAHLYMTLTVTAIGSFSPQPSRIRTRNSSPTQPRLWRNRSTNAPQLHSSRFSARTETR